MIPYKFSLGRRAAVGILALLAVPLAWPQNGAGMPPMPLPGRIIFQVGNLAKRASKYTQVSLDRSLIQMFLSTAKNQPGQAAQAAHALRGLKGVYVQDLKFTHPGEYSMSTVASIARQLRNPAWITIVRSRSAKENVWVSVQRNREMITALAIVDAKPRELALINIVGPIRLNELGSLSGLSGMDLSKLAVNAHGRTPLPVRPPAPPKPHTPPPPPAQIN